MECTCGHWGCANRIKLGHLPFCRLPREARREPTPANVFGSYVEAAAHAAKHGGRVRAAGGYSSGCARAFVVVAK